jgi:NitT/TauT family transport system permease protein
MKTFFTRNNTLLLFGSIAFLAIWKVIAMASTSLVPAPEETASTFISIISTRTTINDLYTTASRGIAGFFIAFALALVLGILAGLRSGFYSFFTPFVVVFRSTPVVAFILLLLIWFDTSLVPVIIAFITMFPIIYTNTTQGIQAVDGDLKEMMQVYQLSGKQRLQSVYMPSISAFLFSGAATAMGFGWRAIIIGEVLSQPAWGIGARMREAYGYFEVKELISWTIIAILLSLAFELALLRLEKHILRWKKA